MLKRSLVQLLLCSVVLCILGLSIALATCHLATQIQKGCTAIDHLRCFVIFVRLLKNWYSHMQCCVKWNNVLGDAFPILCGGVRQGGVISPYLFAVYVDDLIIQLTWIKAVWSWFTSLAIVFWLRPVCRWYFVNVCILLQLTETSGCLPVLRDHMGY